MITFDRIGQYTGSEDLQASLAREGFVTQRRRNLQAAESAARLFADVLAGREDPVLLREAFMPQHEYIVAEIGRRYPGLIQVRETMATSDFSNYLTADVLDRMLYGYYTTSTVPVMPLVKKTTLRDFRSVKRFEVDGAVKPFSKHQGGEPPLQRSLTAVTPITYSPDLYQGMMSVNWRAIINDDLGIFNDLVQRLASSWNLTIWKAITSLYVASTGPSTSLYAAGFRNLITPTYSGGSLTNPPLSFQGLAEGYTVLLKQVSPDSYPIDFTGNLYLVVPPALAMTAKALKQSVQNQLAVLGGKLNASGFPETRLNVNGLLVPDFEIIVDKMIPIVCTNASIQNTMWCLTYDPSTQARPSIEFGMLRGFETPQLFQKLPNTMRVGGAVDPTMGDFLTMDIDYKAIAVFGGSVVDGRSTVASTGAGS